MPTAHVSASVRQLLETGSDGGNRSGELALQLFTTHPQYGGQGLLGTVSLDVGRRRTAAEHVASAAATWDTDGQTHQHGRSVLLGLAIGDPELARVLLLSGLLAELLGTWPGPGNTNLAQPTWERLSAAGQATARQVPALVASLGGPPDWVVDLPAASTRAQLVWSPDDTSVGVFDAGLLQQVTHGVAGPAQPPLLRLGELTGEVWGWSADGPAVSTVVGDSVVVVDALGQHDHDGTPSARLSGDAQRLITSTPTTPLTVIDIGTGPPNTGTTNTGPPAAVGVPLVVDPAGRFVLLATDDMRTVWDVAVLSAYGREPLMWSGAPAAVTGVLALSPPFPPGPGAVGTLLASGDDTLALRLVTFAAASTSLDPHLCVLRLPGPVQALAFSRRGDRLAVLAGHRLRVVGLALSRPEPPMTSAAVFTADQATGEDLVGVERDVNALAALLCSTELRPPVTVGILGDWGSGKSFVLGRLRQQVRAYAQAGRARGFVDTVRIVDFNAWHYAESDIWASLVEQVRLVLSAPDADTAKAEREAAQKRLDQLHARLVRQRRLLLAAAVLTVVLVVPAVVLAVLRGSIDGVSARVLAACATVVAAAAAVSEGFSRFQTAKGAADELLATGRRGQAVVDRVYGPGSAAALDAAEAELRRCETVEAASTLTDARSSPGNGALAEARNRLRDSGDFAARLTLISHTRRLFDDLSRALAHDVEEPQDGAGTERVLVVIDDLDRCPPDKVVDVLQAVHLLFDFPLFTVILAVDTRWLRRSLQAHYRELLGGAAEGAADPMDYLEKIIQIPVQLRPLSQRQVRRMMDGLTGHVDTTPAGLADVVGASSAQSSSPDPPTQVTPASRFPPRSVAGAAEASSRPGTSEVPIPTADAPTAVEQPLVAAAQLRLSVQEKLVLAGLAPLVGATPRTVKRFVNVYQLLKAREPDTEAFVSGDEPVADFAVAAFLLALVTGQRNVAPDVVARLAADDCPQTLGSVLESVRPHSGDASRELRTVRSWVAERPHWARAPAGLFRRWAPEVARYSFLPTAPSPRSARRPEDGDR